MKPKSEIELSLGAKLAAIRERRRSVPESPWFAFADTAQECGPHRDSGLALVDTGRESDWPIARLCYWPVAEFIANAPEDIDTLFSAYEVARNDALEEAAKLCRTIADDYKNAGNEIQRYAAQHCGIQIRALATHNVPAEK